MFQILLLSSLINGEGKVRKEGEEKEGGHTVEILKTRYLHQFALRRAESHSAVCF